MFQISYAKIYLQLNVRYTWNPGVRAVLYGVPWFCTLHLNQKYRGWNMNGAPLDVPQMVPSKESASSCGEGGWVLEDQSPEVDTNIIQMTYRIIEQ